MYSQFPFGARRGFHTSNPRLAKTIVQGTVKGERRKGRQRKRWDDNIREWTSLEFGKSQREWRTGKNGENWLQNRLWCPNDPRG